MLSYSQSDGVFAMENNVWEATINTLVLIVWFGI